MTLVIQTRPRYPRRMNQPSNPFADLAISVLPEQTSGRLARVFDVNQRVAQRWISGDLDVPQDVIELLEQQRALLAKSNPGPGIQRAIDDAKTAGLHDEILGAYLSLAYEHLLQRRIR